MGVFAQGMQGEYLHKGCGGSIFTRGAVGAFVQGMQWQYLHKVKNWAESADVQDVMTEGIHGHQ